MVNKYLNEIELPKREYFRDKIIDYHNGKYPVYRYHIIDELTTFEDMQIIRRFECYPDSCVEVERYYIKNGKSKKMSLGLNYWNGKYEYNYDTKFIIRKPHYYERLILNADEVIINDVLKVFKFITRKTFYKNVQVNGIINWCDLFLKWDNKIETIAKINKTFFCNLWRTYGTAAMINIVKKRSRQFELITKWKYKVPKKDTGIYIDYLRNLETLGLDLRSPKYLCPVNLHDEHNKLVARITKKKEDDKLSRLKNEIKRYEKLMNNYQIIICDNFKLIPLKTINDVKNEAKVQKHCIYTNEYFAKENVALFTTETLSGEKLETIEYNIKDKKVKQCYGIRNSLTDLHNVIIDTANVVLANI